MKRKFICPETLRKLSKIDVKTGCWVYQGWCQSSGYGQMYVEGKRLLLHRLSWEEHNGAIPAGASVLHKCDNPPCINPEHLFLGSHKDNSNDAQQKGRLFIQNAGRDFAFTKTNRRRKLSNEDVDYIRKSPRDLAWLAKKFNVSKSCISLVRNNKRKKLV